MSAERMKTNSSPLLESRLDIWQAMIGQSNRPCSALTRTAIEGYVERDQPALLRGIGRALGATLRGARRRYRLRREVRVLRSLSDGILKDIGLTRGDIEAVAGGALTTYDLNSLRTTLGGTGNRAVTSRPFDHRVTCDRVRIAPQRAVNDPHMAPTTAGLAVS